MTETLFTLTHRVARELGILTEGTATGGAATTIIDTNDRAEVNDFWNGGSAWITRDAGGANAAPQGEYSTISDFVSGTGTITLGSTLTATVAAGDRYAIANKRFPLQVLRQMVNAAVSALGKIPVIDTSLVIADNQTEYTLPTGCRADNLRTVHYQTELDTNDNRWVEVLNWRVQVAATGTAHTLILPAQYTTGYKLKLTYVASHPELYSAADKLSELVPVERIIYHAAYLTARWWKDKFHQATLDQTIQTLYERHERARQEMPIWAPRKPGRVVMVSDREVDESGYDKVHL